MKRALIFALLILGLNVQASSGVIIHQIPLAHLYEVGSEIVRYTPQGRVIVELTTVFKVPGHPEMNKAYFSISHKALTSQEGKVLATIDGRSEICATSVQGQMILTENCVIELTDEDDSILVGLRFSR